MSHITYESCDECGTQAYVTTTLDTGLTLTWCAHHYQARSEQLAAYTEKVIDMRHLLHANA